jgi:hypothetical protein
LAEEISSSAFAMPARLLANSVCYFFSEAKRCNLDIPPVASLSSFAVNYLLRFKLAVGAVLFMVSGCYGELTLDD